MKILIVDDEPAILADIEALVKEYDPGGCAHGFTDPLEAIAAMQCGTVDCALLDIEMAGLNGLELTERIQKKCPAIQIIYITAYNNYATEAFERSAIDYVLKPLRKDRLFKALDKARAVALTRAASMKQDLRIFTFGKLIVMKGNEAIKWQRNSSEEVFAYLLENAGVPIHKDALCELAWPDFDYKKALVNLQSAIYSIRKALHLEDGQRIDIEYANSCYTLSLNSVPVDFLEFERLLKLSVETLDTAAFGKAVRLYKRGEYLAENGWTWAEVRRASHQRKLDSANRKLHAAVREAH